MSPIAYTWSDRAYAHGMDSFVTQPTVEQASDGTWTASVTGEQAMLGTGDTKVEALRDLRHNLEAAQGSLKKNWTHSIPKFRFPRMRNPD